MTTINRHDTAELRALSPLARFAYNRVMLETAAAYRNDGRGYTFHASADDWAMCAAHGDDLLAWVDDLEARVFGYSLDELRAVVIDFIFCRDGGDDSSERERVDALRKEAADYIDIGTEFGATYADELQEDMPEIDARMIANPWHNDVCPKWEAELPNGAMVVLWAELRDASVREVGNGARFTVCVHVDSEAYGAGECVEQFDVETPADLPAAVSRALDTAARL